MKRYFACGRSSRAVASVSRGTYRLLPRLGTDLNPPSYSLRLVPFSLRVSMWVVGFRYTHLLSPKVGRWRLNKIKMPFVLPPFEPAIIISLLPSLLSCGTSLSERPSFALRRPREWPGGLFSTVRDTAHFVIALMRRNYPLCSVPRSL